MFCPDSLFIQVALPSSVASWDEVSGCSCYGLAVAKTRFNHFLRVIEEATGGLLALLLGARTQLGTVIEARSKDTTST